MNGLTYEDGQVFGFVVGICAGSLTSLVIMACLYRRELAKALRLRHPGRVPHLRAGSRKGPALFPF